jgi:uncharacterized membrane protein
MGYNYIKLIHLAAVIIFLGNIITGLFWMSFAVKTRDLKIINHTMKGIIKADRYFTIPGVIVVTAGGFLAAINSHIPVLGTGWIFWSVVMFSFSGLAFGFKLVPLQKKIFNLTLGNEKANDFNWETFSKAYFNWDIWGLIALLTPLAALVMMVLKIPK